ncbi:aromatic ring-hydroxylating dioxygenase subunit alpha [Paraburkholderia oxyphila]|uniref:aromatic ring-hydroxylating dioxygenase subunit alpha n=1 Tax=Paraburkholderia oxyphila TaxID=614212 RepID=UPI0005BDA8F6|nr:aromatic ring-hydroxylating dioxygenase subunit alpha [Paraburkholderia oxyphila]
MKFLRNAWYVVAWCTDIKRELFERTVINESLVLYRTSENKVVCLSNRCPHRFAPLHLGRIVDDRVECGYHGLVFDGSGRCTHNPHGDHKIPQAACVQSYLVEERHNLVWIWMGNKDLADPSKIPDFSCLTDTLKFSSVVGAIEMNANYELITDNLMDLSHVEYVHRGILGSDAISRGKTEVIDEGATLHSNRWCPDGLAPPAWDAMFGNYGKHVDHWLNMRWNAPAHMLLDVGITPTGKHRDDGIWMLGTDILTPSTEEKTFYFWGVSRAYALDDPAAGEAWVAAIDGAFSGQDKPMLEAQQRMIGNRDLWELNPVLIPADAGAVRARRKLAALIAAESAREEEKPAGEKRIVMV